MSFMTVFIFLVFLGLIPAMIAKEKGEDFIIWWIYGAALLIVALSHALLLEQAGGTKVCPHCAETIKKAAAVCKHCNRDQPPMPPSDVPAGDDYIPDVF